MDHTDVIVTISQLCVDFSAKQTLAAEPVRAVQSVDFVLHRGQMLALVGESGSGKSTLARSLIGLVPQNAIVSGYVCIDGIDVSRVVASPLDPLWNRIRGRKIGFVPQSATTFLTPNRTIGGQLKETINTRKVDSTIEHMFERVGLTNGILHMFLHEMSGGMAARVAFAFALVGNPDVVIADESTANLDAQTTGEQLALLRDHADQGGCVLCISHDLESVLHSSVFDEIAVMREGRIVERASPHELRTTPQHAYSRALVNAALRTNTGEALLYQSTYRGAYE